MGLFNNFPYTDFHRLNLDWILKFTKSVRDRLDLIDAAVTSAQAARDEAETYATNAENSATEAASSRDIAYQAASDAEDFKTAAQQSAGSALDSKTAAEAAQMSAQQSAQTATSRATAAAQSATAAAGSATAAAGSAAQAADAEAWAVGTQGGVPVPSTAEQYNNNAKYWAEQAGLAPGADVFAITHEYFDNKTLNYTNWGFRAVTADNDGVIFVSVSETENNSEHIGELGVKIDKIVSGQPVTYAETVELGTDDPTRVIGVDTAAFIKVNAGDVVRLGAYRHAYLTGTPTMVVDTNIIAIGTTLTIDNNYTPAI